VVAPCPSDKPPPVSLPRPLKRCRSPEAVGGSLQGYKLQRPGGHPCSRPGAVGGRYTATSYNAPGATRLTRLAVSETRALGGSEVSDTEVDLPPIGAGARAGDPAGRETTRRPQPPPPADRPMPWWEAAPSLDRCHHRPGNSDHVKLAPPPTARGAGSFRREHLHGRETSAGLGPVRLVTAPARRAAVSVGSRPACPARKTSTGRKIRMIRMIRQIPRKKSRIDLRSSNLAV
jgi:hypothetical protein